MALTEEGYGVIVADNGAQALELLTSCHPALVVLDMKMPVLDGWGFLSHYCTISNPPAPVIAMSAHVREITYFSCIKAFFAKPVDLDKLLNVIQTILAR